MSEVDEKPKISWYWILRTKTAAIRLGESPLRYLRVEPLRPDNADDKALADLLDAIPHSKKEYFLTADVRDYRYRPPREVTEEGTRWRLGQVEGFPTEFDLEYLPQEGERYIVGTQEWEDLQKLEKVLARGYIEGPDGDKIWVSR